MDKHTYTLGEAVVLLNTNRPRLTRYIKRLGIKTRGSIDYRTKVLSARDVLLLKEALENKAFVIEQPVQQVLDITRP